MILGHIKKSKYDKHFENFMNIKNKKSWYTLKKYCDDNNISYMNMRRGSARRGYQLHKSESVYTILQISVNKNEHDNIKNLAKERNMSIAEAIRSLINAI
jgi:hypothetical protein